MAGSPEYAYIEWDESLPEPTLDPGVQYELVGKSRGLDRLATTRDALLVAHCTARPQPCRSVVHLQTWTRRGHGYA